MDNKQQYEAVTRRIVDDMASGVFQADSAGKDSYLLANQYHALLWGNYMLHRTERPESMDAIPKVKVIGGVFHYLRSVNISKRGLRNARYQQEPVTKSVLLKDYSPTKWRMALAFEDADYLYLPFRPINTDRVR